MVKLGIKWKDDGMVEYVISRNGVILGTGTVNTVSDAEAARDLVLSMYDA